MFDRITRFNHGYGFNDRDLFYQYLQKLNERLGVSALWFRPINVSKKFVETTACIEAPWSPYTVARAFDEPPWILISPDWCQDEKPLAYELYNLRMALYDLPGNFFYISLNSQTRRITLSSIDENTDIYYREMDHLQGLTYPQTEHSKEIIL